MTKPKPINWTKLGKLATERLDPRDRVVTRKGFIALRGRHELSAAEYLSVCAALDLDPVTQAPPDPAAWPADGARGGMPAYAGQLVWPLVAMGVVGRRAALGLTMEQAGLAIGISAMSLSRVCRGDPMSASVFLKVCAWLGKHPNEMTVPPGSLEREADPFSRAEANTELEKSAPVVGRVNAR